MAPSKSPLLQRAVKEVNADLHTQFEDEKRKHDGIAKVIGDSGRFPLCARGRINTYSIFTELARHLVGASGRIGIIIPTGICTDDNNKEFFQDLADHGSLQSLFDFENAKGLFAGVHRSFKFCLLTLRGADARGVGEFAFFLHDPADLRIGERRFVLGDADFALLNPNTKTCPIFRSRRDAELTKRIYQRIPVLWDEIREDGNPWGLSLKQGLFNMTSDSGLFRLRGALEAEGFRLHGNRFVKDTQVMLPLYEAKMVHQFDHRFGDYRDLPEDSSSTQLPDVPLDRLQAPNFEPLPRYWVAAEEVQDRLRKTDRQGNVEWSWPHEWLLGWRDICRSTDERTVIASVIPRVAVGNKFPLMLMSPSSAQRAAWLAANLSSLAHDFAARQKIGGTAMNFFIYKQLPVLPPSAFEASAPWSGGNTVGRWVEARVAELLVTSHALLPFGRELGVTKPFPFDPARRFQLRCELDAAFFHLYGLTHDEVDYVMDTFPIVRRHDEAEHGDYRTKLTILDLYDQMAEAAGAGRSVRSVPAAAPATSLPIRAPRQPALPPVPVLVPALAADAEYAISSLALLHAAGGTITRMDLARAFVLRSNPSLLQTHAPTSLVQAAEWAVRVNARDVPAGRLTAILRELEERGAVSFAVSAVSQSVVTVGPNTPPEDQIDPWFRFEARLALAVLRTVPVPALATIDGRLAGADRSLVELAS